MMPHEWPKTKSYVAGKDLFLFSVFCIVTKKTDNTGAGKLCGRAHPMADGVYLLYRLLEDDSTKSYGEEKTNRNSTDNNKSAPTLAKPSFRVRDCSFLPLTFEVQRFLYTYKKVERMYLK